MKPNTTLTVNVPKGFDPAELIKRIASMENSVQNRALPTGQVKTQGLDLMLQHHEGAQQIDVTVAANERNLTPQEIRERLEADITQLTRNKTLTAGLPD